MIIRAESKMPLARKYFNLLGPELLLKAKTKLKGRIIIKKPTRFKREPVGLKVLAVR